MMVFKSSQQEYLIYKLVLRLRKQIQPAGQVETKSHLNEQANYVCEQFLTFYLDKCMSDLVRDRRYTPILYFLNEIFLDDTIFDATFPYSLIYLKMNINCKSV